MLPVMLPVLLSTGERQNVRLGMCENMNDQSGDICISSQSQSTVLMCGCVLYVLSKSGNICFEAGIINVKPPLSWRFIHHPIDETTLTRPCAPWVCDDRTHTHTRPCAPWVCDDRTHTHTHVDHSPVDWLHVSGGEMRIQSKNPTICDKARV